MSFLTSEALWAFLLLPCMALILCRSYKKKRRELQKVVKKGSLSDSVDLLRSFFSGFFLLLTFVFLILAMSGPKWGDFSPIEDSNEGLDVALVIDISHSMLARDIKPSRLAIACEEAKKLVQAFPRARFSLVVFKGGAITLVPLTPDTELLERYLNDLSPAVLHTKEGTNLEVALQEAWRSLSHPNAHRKVIVLFSDGETHDGNALAVTPQLSNLGAKIFSVGIGTSQGATIPKNKGIMLDQFGFTVQTRLNEEMLKMIASETGGNFYLLGADSLQGLQNQLATLYSPALQRGIRLEPVKHDRLFLFLALGTFITLFFIRILPWKKAF